MFIRLILQLIFGYVRIETEGFFIERFINICTNKKILIWNLKRENGIKLYLNCGIKEYKKIVKIAKKTSCRIKIIKKNGVPFFLNKYKKRKIFAFLCGVIIFLICISSQYVWNIEVNVKDNVKIENIIQDLENLGLKKGVLKRKINTEKIINEIRLKRNDIAWIRVEYKWNKCNY